MKQTSSGAEAGPSPDPFSDVDWEALLFTLQTVVLNPGDILFRQGDQGDTAYFLREGAARIFLETHYGETTLATRHAPCLIGEIAAFASLPRTASAEAVVPTTAYRITRQQLLDIGRKNPELLLSVIRRMGEQIDSVNKVISTFTGALTALEKRDIDPDFLGELVNPSPQAMEFAAAFKRFATQIVDRRRQHDELAAAAAFQRSFLPPLDRVAAAGSVLDIDARMRPAREVGGDFYDFFMAGENRLAVAIGDVCGKGMQACIFMAVVITILRAEVRRGGSVSEIIAQTNALLCQDNPASMFATLFYAEIDLVSGIIEYCNCGHNAPLLLRDDGAFTTLPATGLPLGLFEDRSAAMASARISSGDLLLLYTDGVTEATNAGLEEFGDDRLTQTISAIRQAYAADIIQRVFDDVDIYAGGAEQNDDVTCIALRRR